MENFKVVVCVIYGETTTKHQLKRLVESIINQTSKEVRYVFYMKHDELFVDNLSNHLPLGALTIRKVKDDPGVIRNSFITTHVMKSPFPYFAFLDGDDEIEPEYFSKLINHAETLGADLVVGNPSLYYGPKESYPSKWFTGYQMTALDLRGCASSDEIGGQAWGKLYSISLAQARFGKGMFEDVPFWIAITNRSRSVVFCDAKYIWHRDNKNAITRNLGSLESIKNGLINLTTAYELVSKEFKEKFKRRYTWAIITICRNIYRNSDRNLVEVLIELSDLIDTSLVDFSLVDKTSQSWIALIKDSKGEFKKDWLEFLGKDI